MWYLTPPQLANVYGVLVVVGDAIINMQDSDTCGGSVPKLEISGYKS